MSERPKRLVTDEEMSFVQKNYKGPIYVISLVAVARKDGISLVESLEKAIQQPYQEEHEAPYRRAAEFIVMNNDKFNLKLDKEDSQQELLDVIRNGWHLINSFDFGMAGMGRLVRPEFAFIGNQSISFFYPIIDDPKQIKKLLNTRTAEIYAGEKQAIDTGLHPEVRKVASKTIKELSELKEIL